MSPVHIQRQVLVNKEKGLEQKKKKKSYRLHTSCSTKMSVCLFIFHPRSHAVGPTPYVSFICCFVCLSVFCLLSACLFCELFRVRCCRCYLSIQVGLFVLLTTARFLLFVGLQELNAWKAMTKTRETTNNSVEFSKSTVDWSFLLSSFPSVERVEQESEKSGEREYFERWRRRTRRHEKYWSTELTRSE